MSPQNNPTLFTSPIKTLYYLSIVISQFLKNVLLYLLQRWYIVLILAMIILLPRFIVGPH